MYIRSLLSRTLILHPSNINGIQERTVKHVIKPGFNHIEPQDLDNIKDLKLFKRFEDEGKLQLVKKVPDQKGDEKVELVNDTKTTKTNRIIPEKEKKAKG